LRQLIRDVEKKIEAIRFCVQDENFLKEEEVLTNLIGFLSRYKVCSILFYVFVVVVRINTLATVDTTACA
jgi:hypothetical protein